MPFDATARSRSDEPRQETSGKDYYFLGDGCPPVRTPATMAANVNEEENSRLPSGTACADRVGISKLAHSIHGELKFLQFPLQIHIL